MPSPRLIALYFQDEQRAWSIAEQLTSDDATASVCSTSDELYQLVTTSPVNVIIVEHDVPGFLKGLDILTRLAQCKGPCPSLLLGTLTPPETAQAKSLGVEVLPPTATADHIAAAVRNALEPIAAVASVNIPTAALLLAKSSDVIRPLPQLIVRIARMVDDPDATISALSDEISTDARITAELLRTVNSAAMGLSSKIHRLQDAIGLIGIKRTVALVVSAHLLSHGNPQKAGKSNTFEHRLRMRSVLTAAAASTYATMTRQPSPDMAHILALLQDLGIQVLAHELGKPYLQILERSSTISQLHLHSYERDQLGFTHADVSAALLQKWELPASIVQLVWQHHQPIGSTSNSEIDAELLESMQFGEALADLRDQTSVGRTLWFQRLVAEWGRMDVATLRVCLMQSVRRAQDLGQLFNAPVPSELELRAMVSALMARAAEASAEGEAAEAMRRGDSAKCASLARA